MQDLEPFCVGTFLCARILLQSDESGVVPAKKDQDIAAALNTSARSVERVRQHFVEEALESALNPNVAERSHFNTMQDLEPFFYYLH